MVCNVTQGDGFLALRTGPSTKYAIKNKFGNLLTLNVDTSQRRGRWVRVTGAYRTYTKDGQRQARRKVVNARGWAHDRYMCSSFIR